jgi:hypothetical protein
MSYSRFLVIQTTMNSLKGLSHLNVCAPLTVGMVLMVPVSEWNTTHRILVSYHIKHPGPFFDITTVPLTYLSSPHLYHLPIVPLTSASRPEN